MRLRVAVLAVALGLAIPAQVLAGGGWLTTGTGTIAGTTEQWKWSAKSDVGGANVNGKFARYDTTSGTGFEGDVTCLSVVGSTARIGILITKSTEPTRPAGASTFITMSTTGGKDPVNLVGADINFFVPLTVCPSPSGYIDPFDGKIKIEG
jgi:hypothetical protein